MQYDSVGPLLPSTLTPRLFVQLGIDSAPSHTECHAEGVANSPGGNSRAPISKGADAIATQSRSRFKLRAHSGTASTDEDKGGGRAQGPRKRCSRDMALTQVKEPKRAVHRRL